MKPQNSKVELFLCGDYGLYTAIKMFNQQVFTRENREDIGKGKVKGCDTGK